MTFVVGVREVVCTCGLKMTRTGGRFGGNRPAEDTYYCPPCHKHVIVVTPEASEQREFTNRWFGEVL